MTVLAGKGIVSREGGLIRLFGQNKWFGKTKVKDEKIKIGTTSNDFTPMGLKIDNSFEGIFKTKTWKLEELIKETENPVESWIKKFHSNLKKFFSKSS